ncbi:uncharacterized protein DUF4189 [Hoeflea halophila]|uniref:Uncharacterized protein DUF4189 n=1 Tax=Hoeflea halophila TaxID=714899 RepID=A0A286HLE3_9HYPH|nr:DUF4189 domain-containing protein [Hoeflea halophila]SOE08316.1 uncharacterized protein DUF4189 [Hoeflea halophila]
MRQAASSIGIQATLALAFVIMGASSAVSADNFGAIAFSKSTGAYGYSYDHQSRQNAEAVAMNECRSRSRGCKVAIWFKNACGSVAIGPNGWGSAWAGSRGNAERAALSNCSKHTRNCKVLAWTCTTR